MLKGNEITSEELRKEKERINEIALKRYLEAVKETDEKKSKKIMDEKLLLRSKNLDEYDTIAFERIIGYSDLFPIAYLETGLKASESVCRISVRDSYGRIQGYGTGFMISDSLIMTNNHVIKSERVALNSLVEFNFQEDREFMPCPTYNYKLDPDSLFITNEELDFTIIAVKNSELNGKRASDFGYLKLIKETNKILEGEYVSIIQHPKGGPKAVTIRENEVRAIKGDFMHYLTDTEPGSSGSPVFNDQWMVVALHHSGVPNPDKKGDWIANEGVRISAIVNHIFTIYEELSEEKRLLIEKVFEENE
ncbi:MAG: serine protease [Andreesenia angusta]|nr:serine protease [Andreesenia angusta]